MGNGDIFDEDASVFVEVPKMMASKRSFEVDDNAIRETESMDDIFEELDCLLCNGQNKRLVFDPLGELVNGDVYIPKPPGAGLKGPIMSSPQHAKGQEARMVCNSCADMCICLAKN